VILDCEGRTVAAASTLEKDARAKTGATVASRQDVGRGSPSAPRPPASPRVFDRGGFLFHGRVKALADAAREGGLEF
jgi:large subunit ribosomal protein L18